MESQLPPDSLPMSQAAGWNGGHNPNLNASDSNRLFCLVVECPESRVSSIRTFRNFASIKAHLNDHCTGQLSGAVPVNFLSHFDYTQCRVCDKVLHKKFTNSTCPKCRPTARAQNQILHMRNHVTSLDNSTPNNSQIQSDTGQDNLPSLSEIHKRHTPTIKNIPKGLRKLFAQCLTKAIAQAVWLNNEKSWVELQMLAKCTLCRPTRGGKSHKSQRLAWTRGRLQRWLNGERSELWHNMPGYKRHIPKQLSTEAVKSLCHSRCISLAGEGGLSNACKALVSPPPLGENTEVVQSLTDKHPSAENPVNLSAFGPASSSLVPTADVDTVERCIRSFHRLSGGGPSGLRPIHLKNCLSTIHRDEALE